MSAQIIHVAAGLVFHKGKLLITQRRLNDHLGGLWEFPGGKLEPGESFDQCLVRELREELGIEVEISEQIEDITHAYAEKTDRLKFLRCRLRAVLARPIHCHALVWISRDDLGRYEFPAADARLLHVLLQNAELWSDQ